MDSPQTWANWNGKRSEWWKGRTHGLWCLVLCADSLNIVLYAMNYSSVKCVSESYVLNQALRKFILPLRPSPSPSRFTAANGCCFIHLARCCLSDCDPCNHSVTSVALCCCFVPVLSLLIFVSDELKEYFPNCQILNNKASTSFWCATEAVQNDSGTTLTWYHLLIRVFDCFLIFV